MFAYILPHKRSARTTFKMEGKIVSLISVQINIRYQGVLLSEKDNEIIMGDGKKCVLFSIDFNFDILM